MTEKWIIVRHSAFGYKADARFERGLEVRGLSAAAAKKFEARGAKTFTTYKEASDWAQKEMYPPVNAKAKGHGLIPRAPGMFLRATVDGLQVYVPEPT